MGQDSLVFLPYCLELSSARLFRMVCGVAGEVDFLDLPLKPDSMLRVLGRGGAPYYLSGSRPFTCHPHKRNKYSMLWKSSLLNFSSEGLWLAGHSFA
ncbi:hypothetical protein AVEN_120408-1 [Araneus ventricosus]|uniref:Uncharacterized protein n=1 Tax=Araneus ventricosus TaxID=182803 RepID=A0A4Y2MWJ8_ARAVE|nr:hypothetical protein AVEN_120408-1 [Araneus ventricosus]